LEVNRVRLMVSGSQGGIGSAFVSAAHHRGWSVVELARSPGPEGVRVDVMWPEEKIAGELASLGRLDGLICCHGADISSPPLGRAPYQDRLDALYQVDIAGTIKLVRAAWPLIVPGGTIVLLGSDEVEVGRAGDAAGLYATAKGAVTAYAKSLAASDQI
jgi:3-oxoacyl-[acyl-carrier protein] reductase